MVEGRRVVAGEAILSGLASESSRVKPKDAACGVEGGAAQQQEEALATLVERLVWDYSRMVYRIAYAVLRRHHDAEDATQETFLRVLRYRAKLEAVRDTKTWLARIAWRVAVDRARTRSDTREVVSQDLEQPFAKIAAAGMNAEERVQCARFEAELERLIAALPAKLRQPLILSTIEEMSPREIAATLAINEAAVRSRVFRARQILKEKLAKRIDGKQATP